jgi:hypothetical protein
MSWLYQYSTINQKHLTIRQNRQKRKEKKKSFYTSAAGDDRFQKTLGVQKGQEINNRAPWHIVPGMHTYIFNYFKQKKRKKGVKKRIINNTAGDNGMGRHLSSSSHATPIFFSLFLSDVYKYSYFLVFCFY